MKNARQENSCRAFFIAAARRGVASRSKFVAD
jgi:hypothetical protein